MKPPGTLEAVKEIYRDNGFAGLYTGFHLHFSWFSSLFLSCSIAYFCLSLVRDTAGTALYFLEYDGMRHLLGRHRSGEQGPTPSWLPVPASLVPFICGSVSGVMLHNRIRMCRVDQFGRLLLGLLFTPWMCRFSSATISLIDWAKMVLNHLQRENQSSTTVSGWRTISRHTGNIAQTYTRYEYITLVNSHIK